MTEKINKTTLIASLFFIIASLPIMAEELAKPIDVKNTHILYISHLLLPAEGSSSLQNGSDDISINVLKSSTNFDTYLFKEKKKQGNFDVETTSIFLNYIHKFGDSTELKAALPFFHHGGGLMDHPIESFHKAFPGGGLDNGGREYSKDNEIHIQYQPTLGGPDINKSFYGVGDPSFFIKKILLEGNFGMACAFGVKPPAGKKAFINSRTTDIGITLNADYKAGIFNLYAMGGCSYFYGNGIYKDELEQSRDYMINSAIGAGVTAFGTLYFSIQFYIHSSLYDTGIARIDNPTVMNSFSARWQMNDQMTLQFCFDEDSITYAAADITFSLRTEYTF